MFWVQSYRTEVQVVDLDLTEDAVIKIVHEVKDLGLLR